MPEHICRCGGTGWDGCVPTVRYVAPISTETIDVLREANRRDETNRVTLADLWAESLDGLDDDPFAASPGVGWNTGFPALSAARRDLDWEMLARGSRVVES